MFTFLLMSRVCSADRILNNFPCILSEIFLTRNGKQRDFVVGALHYELHWLRELRPLCQGRCRLFAQMLVNRVSIQYVTSCMHLGPASRVDSLGSLSQLLDTRWQNIGGNSHEMHLRCKFISIAKSWQKFPWYKKWNYLFYFKFILFYNHGLEIRR